MNYFIYPKPIWAYQIWKVSPGGDANFSGSPILAIPIDYKLISISLSRLLPKVQRQILLDFGEDDNMFGD